MGKSFISLYSLEDLVREKDSRVRMVARDVYLSEREYGGLFSEEDTGVPERKA